MSEAAEEIFLDEAPIDREAAADARMKWEEVPAKGAVYALYAEEEKPLLLATVGNLRAALARRLSDVPAGVKSKRIPYGQICTRVRWRVVYSGLAADYFYYQAARAFFPATYREIVPRRAAWWLGLEREAEFPKIRRTQDLSDAGLRYAGPIRDKGAAGKLAETLEDLFDLCRYHHILVQAPNGKACAYKEMGKCPAPCDGSVSMEWYRRQIQAAFDFLLGTTREAWFANTQTAMRSAAKVQEFELANRIKQRLTRAAYVAHEAFAHLGPLENFSYVSLQNGKGKAALEPWVIHGGQVTLLGQLHKKTLETDAAGCFAKMREIFAMPVATSMDAGACERMGIVTHHLFRGEKEDTRFFPAREVGSVGGLVDLATRCFLRDRPEKAMMEHASDAGESGGEEAEIAASE